MCSGSAGYQKTIGARSEAMHSALQSLKAGMDNGKVTSSMYSGVISKLPKNPEELKNYGWKEITNPSKKVNRPGSLDFKDTSTDLTVNFDKGENGAPGNRGKDHYHVLNPNRTGKDDYYLDKDGKPCRKGSPASHIKV